MTEQTRSMPTFVKYIMRFQAFMLRRNMMGKMGDAVMVITVRGRKSGKAYSTPIGYLNDGSDVIALTRKSGGGSNWYKNVLANPEVTLNIKGQDIRARGTPITDANELTHLLELYKKSLPPQMFARMFDNLTQQSPEAELQNAFGNRVFVRFKRM